jgi:hypothetical protein
MYVGRDGAVGNMSHYVLNGSGDQIPVGGDIFFTRPDRPWCPPSLLYDEHWISLPLVKRPGVTLTTHATYRRI